MVEKLILYLTFHLLHLCDFYIFFSDNICLKNTVKTLYNIIRYNRIFNIRHKIAGNGSVSIKIPAL